MKRMGRSGIATKLVVLTVGIVITAVTLTTVVCLGGMRREMVRVAGVSQEARLKTFWELITAKGSDFRIVDNRLMAGDYVINGNHELPDRLREICGGTATIFMRDERISTNVQQADGTRAVGTKLQGPAYDSIFKEGKPYRGVADILGEPYFTAYDPIRDHSGEIIGVLYVGVKTGDFLASFNRLRLTVAGVAGLLAVICSAGIFFFTRRLLAPIHQAVAVTGAVAEGDLTAEIPSGAGDEAGRVLDSVRIMVDALNTMIGKVNHSAGRLKEISEGVAAGAAAVVRAASLEQQNVVETSSAIEEIAESAREVGEEASRLASAAGETSASVLEMVASVEEVAQNADRLAALVEEVTASITQSVVAAREIGSSVRTLADASSTTASSIAELDTTINQVEQSARRTAAVSTAVVSDAEKGRRAVDAMVAGMSDIRSSSHITAEVIDTLSTRADDIGVITSVIDDIARQTSLLALNAAIIAAQAGEHGRGFAVVAEQIKILSDRTATSTGEISTLVIGVQHETQRAVAAIQEAERSIAAGAALSGGCSEALAKIVEGVTESGRYVEEIARATAEQARGTRLIRQAMEQVSDMTARIEIATREQTGAGEVVTRAAERMRYLTAQVRSSTREQSKVGAAIARATEEIHSMIRRVEIACREQAEGSRQIAGASAAISDSAAGNVGTAELLAESARALAEQVDILHEGTGAFRIR